MDISKPVKSEGLKDAAKEAPSTSTGLKRATVVCAKLTFADIIKCENREEEQFKTEEEKKAALAQNIDDSFNENYKNPNHNLTEFINQVVARPIPVSQDFDTRVKVRRQEDNKRQKLRREEALRYGGAKKTENNLPPERGYLAPRLLCKRTTDGGGDEEPPKRSNNTSPSPSTAAAVAALDKDNKMNEESAKDNVITIPD